MDLHHEILGSSISNGCTNKLVLKEGRKEEGRKEERREKERRKKTKRVLMKNELFNINVIYINQKLPSHKTKIYVL